MEHRIMYFTSTRSRRNVTSAQAITRGLAEDGGLFIPSEFPKISGELIDRMHDYRMSSPHDINPLKCARCIYEPVCGYSGVQR